MKDRDLSLLGQKCSVSLELPELSRQWMDRLRKGPWSCVHRYFTLLQNTDIFPAQTEVTTENCNICKSNSVTFWSPSPWLKEGTIVKKLLEIGILQSKNIGRNKYYLSFFMLWGIKKFPTEENIIFAFEFLPNNEVLCGGIFFFSFESFSFAQKDYAVASVCNYKCVTWIERRIYYWSAVMSYCKRELKSLL